MTRKVFYSFHYKPDNWRVSTVRSIGALEDNQPCSDNDWESITKGGDSAIEKWINEQMSGRSCAVLLIGKETAGRKWIEYEIKKAWGGRKGLVGVHIHNLLDRDKKQTTKGKNPFTGFTLNDGKERLDAVVKTYDPPFSSSKSVYDHIRSNLEDWVDEAITIRNEYKPK